MIIFDQMVAAGLPLMAAHESAWLDNWRAAGDAIAAVKAALRAWGEAEQAMHACPQYRRNLAARRGACDCHGPAILEAHAAYVAAVPVVDEAVATFKAGVRREQLPDDWPEGI